MFKIRVVQLSLMLVMFAGLSACEKDIEFTRTASDPFTLSRTLDIPVYRRECYFENHYGPSPQCGSYQTCHSEWVCHDHKNPASPECFTEELQARGHNGHNDNCHYHQYCETHYHSCHYQVQVCNDVFDHSAKTTFEIEFDPKAILGAGDVDQIGANMYGNGPARKFELKIKSKRYEYAYPKSFYVDLSGSTAHSKTYIKVVKPKN